MSDERKTIKAKVKFVGDGRDLVGDRCENSADAASIRGGQGCRDARCWVRLFDLVGQHTNGGCHCLSGVTTRTRLAVQKKISQLRTEVAVVERERLASIEVEEITEADIEAVEDEIGMGRGAWDMVDHRELILACVKVVCGKLRPELGT